MLKDLNKGERFGELPGLIVARVFDPKQGQPRDDGTPGKLRQGLVLTDGIAEMGFTLWGPDVGQVMKGDQLTLKVGWVNAYTTSQGVEKFDLRLRKEGGWTKVGSGAAIPQAPKPEPQYVPAPDSQPQQPSPVVMVDTDEREKNINRQSARRDAVSICASVEGGVAVDTVLEIARQLYRWAMDWGPHWMEDDVARKRFWAKLGEAGLDSEDAHRELDVCSMYDFGGTEQDALNILILGDRPQKLPERKLAQATEVPPPEAPGIAQGSDAFPVEKISTAGEFYGAIYKNLDLNKTQTLALAGVADHAEIAGTTFTAKYQVVARLAAASEEELK